MFSITSIFFIFEFNSTKLLLFLKSNFTFKKEGVLISIKFFDFTKLINSFFDCITIFL